MADDTVEKIRVVLEGQTAQYEAAMKRASRTTSDEATRIESRMRVLAERIVAAFAVERIADFFKRQLEAAGGLKDLADQAGVTTRQLQVYQFAASQSGVSSEQMQQALMRLTESMSEAQRGSKSQVDAFNQLGVKILDVNGKMKSTDTVLKLIATAYQKSGDKTKYLAAMKDVLGREAQRLIPLLQDGADGVERFGKEAEKSGGILDDKLIAQAKEANDRIDAMETSAAKLAQTLVSKLAPAFTTIANLFNEMLQGSTAASAGGGSEGFATGGRYGGAQLHKYGVGVAPLQTGRSGPHPMSAGQIAAAQAALDKLGAAGGNPRAIGGETSSLDKYLADLQHEVDILGLRGRALAENKALYEAQQKAQDDFNKGLRSTAQLSGEEIEGVTNAAGAVYDYGNAIKQSGVNQYLDQQTQVVAQLKLAGQAITDDEQAQLAANKALAENAAMWDLAQQALADYNAGLRDNLALTPEEIARAKKLADAQVDLAYQNDKAAQALENQKQQMQDVSRLAGDLTENLFNAATGSATWKDVLLNGLKEIFSFVFDQLGKLKGFGGSGGGIFDSGAGGILGSVGDILLSIFGGAGGGLGQMGFGGQAALAGFAPGGLVAAGMPIRVGESGPETFIPSVPGRITPHANTSGGGRDGAGRMIVNASLDNANRDAILELQRMLRALLGTQRRATQAYVMDRARRTAGGVDSLSDY